MGDSCGLFLKRIVEMCQLCSLFTILETCFLVESWYIIANSLIIMLTPFTLYVQVFFSNCWIYFSFLNLKYIEVLSYMNKWLRSFWCLICNVTIKSSCYKIGQILVKHLVIFLNLFFMAVIVKMSDLTQSVFFLSKKPWKSPTHPWVVKDRYL